MTPLLPFELLPTPTMPWYCIPCRRRFPGPRDCSPKEGCPYCGGREIFDINVDLPTEERMSSLTPLLPSSMPLE